MDDFDDLLTPSRRGFEENPFANPFSNDRPHSPDPWASPFANTQQNGDAFGSDAPLDPYVNPYESLTSSSPTKHTHEHDKHDHTTTGTPSSPVVAKVEESPLSDPLDSAAHANEEDEEQPPPRRRPGFRESLDSSQSSFDETATIRPTEPELFDGLSPIPSSKSAQPPPSAKAAAPQPIQEALTERDDEDKEEESSRVLRSRTPTASTSGLDTAAKTPVFASALDNGLGGAIGIEGSMAGLSLGHDEFVSGGGPSGWSGGNAWGASSEPIPSTSTASTSGGQKEDNDDDSDDDKPISQTLSRIQLEDSDRAVCSLFRCQSRGRWLRINTTS